ncbi:uncharacterized protein LOC128260668 [Drosophila gunungcola]|uniref:MD-2-related lipid-recognition domain-containing protein n=1 Tax=Drosophila gunungcola TaxID=103775 RepID=A0A9P9YEB5_9MUSC|nr:uncharacterized protein LOC128260668 [Drosophila gunungcola]KAI8035439.1 hypothetical protein M5D96_011782 [Drosophila gunungcola]
MARRHSSLGLLTIFLPILLAQICLAEKPYSVELNTFERDQSIDNQDKWVDWGTLRMKKIGRNQFAVSGDFEFKLNMGDEQKITLRVFVYDSKASRKGPLVMNVNKPFCKFIKEDEDTYPHIQKVSNLPEQGKCPFPKGKYTIDKYEMETNFLPDNAPKGDYLLQLSLQDRDIPVAGLVATVTLT